MRWQAKSGVACGVLALVMNVSARSGSIHVSVVDAFGGPVSKARVRLVDPSGRSFEAAKQSGGFLAAPPPGPYTLTVEAMGFRRTIKAIVVSPEPVHMQVGLVLAVVGDPAEEPIKLNGRVRNCPATQAWVRLTGLYAEATYQARLALDCSFSFTDLTGGDFLAYVIAQGRVLATKQVRIAVDNPPLVIETAPPALR